MPPQPNISDAPQRKISLAGSTLAVAHAIFVAWIYSQHFEGSWGGFLVFAVDLPASLLFFPLSKISSNPWLNYVLVGTVWWYLVGHLATSLFRHFANGNRIT